MRGWTISNNQVVDTDDLEQIKGVMPSVIAQLELLADQLDADLGDEELKTLLHKIDWWFEHWNRNANVIAKYERLETVRRVKEDIGKLKESLNEAGVEASS